MNKKGNDKKVAIRVETLPNGYALTVDGNEYMYFNAQELLAGVFLHVGVGKLDFINIDQAEMLLEVILSWPSVKDAAKAQLSQVKDLAEVRKEAARYRRNIADLSRKLDEANEAIREKEKRLSGLYNRLNNENTIKTTLTKTLSEVNDLRFENLKLQKKCYDKTEEIASLKRKIAKQRRQEAANDNNKTKEDGNQRNSKKEGE